MRNLLLIFLCFFLSKAAFSSEVDSLKAQLIGVENKIERIEILQELSWQLAGIDNDACLLYAEQSLNLALSTDSKTLIATSYNRIGLAYDYSSKFEMALSYYEACRKIREDLNDIEGVSASYNNIGGVYYYMGSYDKALEYYLESLDQRKKLKAQGDPNANLLIAQSHNNIAMVHKVMGSFDKAIEAYDLSLELKKASDDQLGVCTSLSNIGALYLEMDMRDSARTKLERALAIAIELDNSFNITMSQNNLGLLELKEGKFDEAIKRYNDLINREIENKNALGEGTGRINLSSALLQNGNISEAINQAEQALSAGVRSGSLVLQENALQLLTDSHTQKGDSKTALNYYKEYVIIKDSLFNIQSDSRYSDLLVEYETKEKEDSIHSLNLSNELLGKESALKAKEIETKTWIGYLLGAGIFFLLLAIIFVIRSSRIKKAALIQENNLKLKSIVSEMDGLRARLESEFEDQPKSNLSIDQTLINDYLMNPLSERELDVLKEVAEGKTNKEIAEALFVSVNTVKTHVLNIYVKLDVQNRTQAAVKAGNLNILKNA